MKFLIDAQLPRRLALMLRENGFKASHTLDLPQGNRTPDVELNRLSLQEEMIVVTKDADFVNSFWLRGEPYKLLLIATGNITNMKLEALLIANLDAVVKAFDKYDFVELGRNTLTLHA